MTKSLSCPHAAMGKKDMDNWEYGHKSRSKGILNGEEMSMSPRSKVSMSSHQGISEFFC